MPEKTVNLTEADCLNILKWWTAASMTVEAKLRTRFTQSERNTIAKISEVKMEFARDAR